MKIAVTYSHPNGNTQLLSECVLNILGKNNVVYFGEPCEEMLNADRFYIGFWTDKGTADNISLEFLSKLNYKEIFLFGSAGFGVDEKYFNKVLTSIKKNIDKSNKIIGEFMCQGKMKMQVKQRYLALKQSDNPPSNINMMIDNFDKALTHPDKYDYEKLSKIISETK